MFAGNCFCETLQSETLDQSKQNYWQLRSSWRVVGNWIRMFHMPMSFVTLLANKDCLLNFDCVSSKSDVYNANAVVCVSNQWMVSLSNRDVWVTSWHWQKEWPMSACSQHFIGIKISENSTLNFFLERWLSTLKMIPHWQTQCHWKEAHGKQSCQRASTSDTDKKSLPRAQELMRMLRKYFLWLQMVLNSVWFSSQRCQFCWNLRQKSVQADVFCVKNFSVWVSCLTACSTMPRMSHRWMLVPPVAV